MRKYDAIIWDWDGTLIDPKQRLYTLFRELTGCSLSYEEYWEFKSQGRKQKDMLDLIGYQGDTTTFHRIWLQNVERQDLLEKDMLIHDVKDGLHRLSGAGYAMHIATNRQSLEGLLWQVKALGIQAYFDKILTTAQKCTKQELIEQSKLVSSRQRTVFVGDSKEDIDVAIELGIDSILVAKEKNEISATYRVEQFAELRNLLL